MHMAHSLGPMEEQNQHEARLEEELLSYSEKLSKHDEALSGRDDLAIGPVVKRTRDWGAVGIFCAPSRS